jgi:hypothetical protein
MWRADESLIHTFFMGTAHEPSHFDKLILVQYKIMTDRQSGDFIRILSVCEK